MVYERKSEKPLEEKQYKGKQLELLYSSCLGRLLLRTIFVSKWFSRLCAFHYNSKRSAKSIDAFIEQYGINMADFEAAAYRSFNDFFTRKLRSGAREIDYSPDSLIAPCDARLTAYKIDSSLQLKIKNSVFGIPELLRNAALSEKFSGGDCLVFRLTADDCHRYVFFDDGYAVTQKKLNGVLHTVRPIAFSRYKVYCENSREYTVMETVNFGTCVYIEVGAMLIGKIRNNNRRRFVRAAEKGFFEYGGSTIILLFEKNRVTVDADISKNSANDAETKVQLGERIGCKC